MTNKVYGFLTYYMMMSLYFWSFGDKEVYSLRGDLFIHLECPEEISSPN